MVLVQPFDVWNGASKTPLTRLRAVGTPASDAAIRDPITPSMNDSPFGNAEYNARFVKMGESAADFVKTLAQVQARDNSRKYPL